MAIMTLEKMREFARKRGMVVRAEDQHLIDEAVAIEEVPDRTFDVNAGGKEPYLRYTMQDGTRYEETRHSGLRIQLVQITAEQTEAA